MQLTDFKFKVFDQISGLRPNFTFLTIKSYVNNWGEISDFSLGFHVNYKNLLIKSKNQLNALDLKTLKSKFSLQTLNLAKLELLSSFEESISKGSNHKYTLNGVYSRVKNKNGILPGILIHNTQDLLHLEGIKVGKRILKPTFYLESDSNDLTLAKKYLRYQLPVGKWRQFKLDQDKFANLAVENLTFLPEDFKRETLKNGS